MVKLEYLLEIDKHWIKVRNWWNNIDIRNELYPKEFKKVNIEDKNIFKIKCLYIIKKIFNIEDITKIDKINILTFHINDIDIFKTLIENDYQVKNIITYFLHYKDYFHLIKKKIKTIVEPLLTNIYFDKLFRCDNDLTRLCCPIMACIVYIYIIHRDLEKTILLSLNFDNISIQFFVISYLILDNFLDDVSYDKENKIIFFKWFMNIVNNPEKEVIINKEENEIWQCIIFKEYYCKFVEKYPVNDNKILYDFVKLMISTLKKMDTLQKNTTKDDILLECTFKKSYVACFFMIIILNNYTQYDLSKKDIYLFCKFLFLVQLYDDYLDINKDIIENNNTYFTTNNIHDKIKKIIISSIIFIHDLNEKNIHISNSINYFLKYLLIYISYMNKDKIDESLINYLLEYSYFTIDLLDIFDKDSYNQYNDRVILTIFKKYILLE